MVFLEFNDVTFTYPPIEGDLDENGKQRISEPVFEHFSGQLPGGCFVSLVGQNGCGKSTLLMLASGRILPDSGSISFLGKNPAILSEEQKNLLASVIYQNMEFESDEPVKNLLAQVYANGSYKAKACAIQNNQKDLLAEVIEVFELSSILEHGLSKLSKGELQRVILAFSLLYGSAAVFMDEPMFAMEEKQKESALTYLKEFIKATGTTIYCSMHELDLTKKFADQVILFYPGRNMAVGTVQEVLTDQDLEKAYNIPAAMLKNKESLTREQLTQIAQQYSKQGSL